MDKFSRFAGSELLCTPSSPRQNGKNMDLTKHISGLYKQCEMLQPAASGKEKHWGSPTSAPGMLQSEAGKQLSDELFLKRLWKWMMAHFPCEHISACQIGGPS